MYQAIAGASAGTGAVAGTLAFTGVRTGALALAALTLVVGGLLLLRLGNSRRRT